ncbi:MAG: DUF1501 domain-containing protein [Pseudomonadota bacterium]
MRRRQFLSLAGLAGIPALGPQLVFGSPAEKAASDRDLLIVIFQRGAADGLNLVVPYTEGPYFDARPTLAIGEPGTAGGALDLDGFFGFHPQLSPLLPLYESGALGVVHAAGSPGDSRSHFDAQDFMEKGVLEKNVVADGWLNRYLAEVSGGTPETFSAVGFGNALPLSLRGPVPSVGVKQLDDYALAAPEEWLPAIRENITAMFDQQQSLDLVAGSILGSVDLLAAADPLSIPTENGAQYPDDTFGVQMSQLAKLIKADLGLEMAAVDINGWDHHDRQVDELGPLATSLAQGMAAFHADMGDAMSGITVITMTEFGRRLAENASEGTDHGHGSVMFAMGGGVNGGQVIADWPGLQPQNLDRGDLDVTTDFRTVLSDMLINRAGSSSVDQIFPDFDGPQSVGLFRSL